ncbi:MAG: 3-oxoadipate enol-lactonase [Rhodobacterales bacterium]|nr:MAG: 3-oxoadipate enol-lactonase [Rhodobacterales bacterium]
MTRIAHNGITTHCQQHGTPEGPAVVFAHALGSDLHLWDQLLPLLPQSLRLICYDLRGHGGSSVLPGEYFMGDLVKDAATLLEALNITECVFVGLSIGGMIAQGLAAERPDLVKALVLSNTACKIATPEVWQQRIDAIRQSGIDAIADVTLQRWFTEAWRRDNPDQLQNWHKQLNHSPLDGYLGCAAAIGQTDLFDSTARLRLPTLVIAGGHDGSTPPDLVRETADLIEGARFELIRNAAHMTAVEQPRLYADILTGFVQELQLI